MVKWFGASEPSAKDVMTGTFVFTGVPLFVAQLVEPNIVVVGTALVPCCTFLSQHITLEQCTCILAAQIVSCWHAISTVDAARAAFISQVHLVRLQLGNAELTSLEKVGLPQQDVHDDKSDVYARLAKSLNDTKEARTAANNMKETLNKSHAREQMAATQKAAADGVVEFMHVQLDQSHAREQMAATQKAAADGAMEFMHIQLTQAQSAIKGMAGDARQRKLAADGMHLQLSEELTQAQSDIKEMAGDARERKLAADGMHLQLSEELTQAQRDIKEMAGDERERKLAADGMHLQLSEAKEEIRESEAVKLRSDSVIEDMHTRLSWSERERAKQHAASSLTRRMSLEPNQSKPVEQIRVLREAKKRQAWKGNWSTLDQNFNEGADAPRIPCIAATTTDGMHFTGYLLKSSGLGREAPIKPLSHAFVVMAGEPFIR